MEHNHFATWMLTYLDNIHSRRQCTVVYDASCNVVHMYVFLFNAFNADTPIEHAYILIHKVYCLVNSKWSVG